MTNSTSALAAQADIVAFLADPATHDGRTVERIDTHISSVFLVGDRVYKLKKAVTLPFLDFAPFSAREAACRAELALNRRTAPDLYLGCWPIVRRTDGTLLLQESDEKTDGEIVDWVVAMRRFDQAMQLDKIAARGELTRPLLGALATQIASFHDKAEQHCERGGAADTRAVVEGIAVSLRRFVGAPFEAEAVERLVAESLAACDAFAAVMDRRMKEGQVRHAHGDLHMANICVVDGAPMIFDCIEFNTEFAVIDVFYDLAFLLMDLTHNGYRREAAYVLNGYLEQRPDLDGLALLPLYQSMRAQIRAFVLADISQHLPDPAPMRADAARYFAEAQAYLAASGLAVVAVGGLSGSGKSRCARELAGALGGAPGAVVARSDVIRKRLAGARLTEHLAPETYTPEMSQRTYAALCEDVRRIVAAKRVAIADAVFSKPEERAAIKAIALDCGVPFVGLWLEADPEVAAQRIEKRVNNASDATVDVLRRQLTYSLGEIEWERVDSSGTRTETDAAALSVIAAKLPAVVAAQ